MENVLKALLICGLAQLVCSGCVGSDSPSASHQTNGSDQSAQHESGFIDQELVGVWIASNQVDQIAYEEVSQERQSVIDELMEVYEDSTETLTLNEDGMFQYSLLIIGTLVQDEHFDLLILGRWRVDGETLITIADNIYEVDRSNVRHETSFPLSGNEDTYSINADKTALTAFKVRDSDSSNVIVKTLLRN